MGLKRLFGLESHFPWMIIDDFGHGALAKGIICGDEFAATYSSAKDSLTTNEKIV